MKQIKQNSPTTDLLGCIRRLSNVERLFLWSFTRCRITFDEHRDAWFSGDSVPRAALRIVPRTSDSQWFDELRREYQVPFEPEVGPLIRFVLVHSSEVSELMVFSEHCICDGTALANLLRDILDCYADPKREVSVIPPPVITDYLQKKDSFSISTIIGSFFINRYNNQWLKKPYYITQEDFNEIHVAYWEKYRYSIALLQLEPEEGHDLAARCRENSVTIGSAMAAAFLAAYYEVIGPLPKNKRTVSTPFDLRRHFKEGNIDGFCFLSGGFNFPFVYDQKKTFWRNVADLHRIIQGRVKALDNWGLDMESFNPTLIDASELS